MGGAQSNNIKNRKSLLDCLKVLIEDVEFYVDEQVLQKMKEIYIQFPNKIEQNMQDIHPNLNSEKLINVFRETIPPHVNQYEDVLLSNVRSFFQYSLLNKQEQKPSKNQDKINVEFIRDFRLTYFDKFRNNKEFQVGYESQLLQLHKALKCYCTLANQIIKQLNQQKDIQCQVYVLIWEHLQNHFPRLGKDKDYDLQGLNNVFDEKYSKIFPQFKVETMGGKLWGNTVQQMDIQFVLEELKISRNNQQSSLPFAQIFNALLDINISQDKLDWIGMSDFQFSKKFQDQVIQVLEKNNLEVLTRLYQQAQGHLIEFLNLWELDNAFLKSVIPEWIVESFLDKQFFSFMEDRITEQVKLMSNNEKKELVDLMQKPEICFDFMRQVNSLNGDFNNINFSYQSQLGIHHPSTLKAIVKQLNVSSSIMSSALTAQRDSDNLINHSNFSDFLEEGSQQKKSEIIAMDVNEINFPQKQMPEVVDQEEQEIVVICKRFDLIKHNIQSVIEARDNNIKKRNFALQSLPSCFEIIFDFTKQINEENIAEIIQQIGEEKKRINYMPFSCIYKESEYQGSNIAAQLLQMIK